MKRILSVVMGGCIAAYGLFAYADNDTITATVTDCINAKKHCMLEVTPPPANSNEKLFKVKQICNGGFEFIYEYFMEDQIANRKFLGRKFCDGIVSYSNMDLPFFKNGAIVDANDGLLVIEILDKATDDISKLLKNMKKIADDASTGSYSPTQLSNMNSEFQDLLLEINRVANVTSAAGTSLLNGSTDSLSIKIGQYQTFPLPLANFTTGSAGLNISALDVLTVDDAKNALSSIKAAQQKVKQALQGFNEPKSIFETSAKAIATITSIDLNGPQFAITTEKPHH